MYVPPPDFLFFKLYLENQHVGTRVGTKALELSPIRTGVPQGAILSQILFNIFSADQPTTPNTSVAEYADNKAIFAKHNDPVIASFYFQNHLNLLPLGTLSGELKSILPNQHM